MGMRPTDFLIEDNTSNDLLFDVSVNGEVKGRGYVERDYALYPESMYAPPSSMTLIPQSEWSERIKEKVATESQLSDMRLTHLNGNPIPSLDQDGVGYCWGHSSTNCNILNRMTSNQPYVPLSAFMVCSIIKKGRDEGGWCGLSQDFIRINGQPTTAYWPAGKRDLSLDTPNMRANAELHKCLEDWVDLTREVYNRNLTFNQLATCLLLNYPCAVDFKWWGHSVCALDLVEVEPGSFGIRIWNSWTDSWGDKGMGILRGEKMYPMGAVSLVTSGASAA